MNNKTSISILQELMAARKKPLPVYVEESFGTLFKCTVYVDGITEVGHSDTKKGAKHNSAKKALEKLSKTVNMAASPQTSFFKNYVGILNEFASRRGVKYPTYELLTCTSEFEFIVECSFINQKANGKGTNKKDAKQEAARNMLQVVGTTAVSVKPVGELSPIYSKVKLEQDAKDSNLYTSLSVTLSSTLESMEAPQIVKEDTIEDLERKIKQLGIQYTISQIQADPYIMCIQVDRTNHCFMGLGQSEKHALKKALLDVLGAWNDGVDFTKKISIEKI